MSDTLGNIFHILSLHNVAHMSEKAKILLTSRLPPELIDQLRRKALVIEGSSTAGNMARADVLSRLEGVSGIINQNELRIDSELLAHAPGLRIVANATAGFDNMSIEAMNARRIWGTNAPESYAADTANHTLGLLLAVTRRLVEADRYVRLGNWGTEGWMPGGRWDGMSLEGKHLGLIGYGNIGIEVRRRAEAFGLVVHHHTRSGLDVPGWLPIDVLLRQSDIVSLHCPLSAETRHLIDAASIRKMKRGAILINVSRGPVVKNDHLIAALKEGQLSGAGLDVFEFEPDVPQELRDMTNVVLSPHLGGCTAEARLSAQKVCVDNVLNVLSGRPPRTPVTIWHQACRAASAEIIRSLRSDGLDMD
jgi:glyoxylate reductase